MGGLPTGTVTFLFTDIEGSTDLLQRLGDQSYRDLLESYKRPMRAAFKARGGTQVDERGEEFFFVFQRPTDAVTAAVEAQRRAATLTTPENPPVRFRIGLHTGEPINTGTVYVGIDVHRAARICAAGHGGQILLSQATSNLVRDELPLQIELRDLGEHRLKDLQRPERLYQLIVPDLPSTFPLLRSLSVVPNNLTIQLTSFIGREREIGEIKRQLAKHRLVTLTGIGGGGKTRLALQVAADLVEAFLHGVWLADLASLSSPQLVIPTIAAAVGVREQSGRSMFETLTDQLRDKSVLLVLDNCEHLIEACAGVAYELLRQCRNLRILTTSREPLGVTGELTYAVPPLGLPNLAALPSAEQLTTIEAVQLFVERAALGQSDFALTERNAQTVARIVARLDGIPLAIELAAVLTKALSVGEIAARLTDRFRLLTGGSRTDATRHQTLKAAMDWSYELLSSAEQTLLRRLSVFRGGFTAEVLEDVGGGPGTEPQESFALLTRLVEKSLVMRDPQEELTRYRLPETVREYANTRLEESGEEPAIRRRHRNWYLVLAERSESDLKVPDQVWFDRLEADHDNLRAAIEYSLATDDAEVALRLGTALWRFWHVRGYWTEGRQRLEAALSIATQPAPGLRAKALHAAGMLAQRQGDYERATALSGESLTLQHTLGDAHGIATSLTTLGNIAYIQANYTSAWELHEESLRYGREAENRHDIAGSLHNLALVADHLGDYQRATALGRESLELFRQTDDKQGIASALHLLGILASDQADYIAARALSEESLAIHREIGHKMGIAAALSNLGLVARERGDYNTARALYEESLSIRRELGQKQGIAELLRSLGRVAWREGDSGRAAAFFKESLTMCRTLGDKAGIAGGLEGLASVSADRLRVVMLLAAGTSLRKAIGVSRSAAAQRDYERLLNEVHSTLGEEDFAAGWSKGGSLTIEQAVEYAMAIEPHSPPGLEGN
ncbi:MAG: tetratricopeptide repeat protein [Armatimonadetes bacterium]|nr:tetratricopeptide repeat protein [Armatimonadota bacterium]